MPDREASADLPTGAALTALDPVFREKPNTVLDRLRTEAPVHKDPQTESVFLTRYEDGRAALFDRSYSQDPRKARVGTTIRTAFGVDRTDRPYEPTMLVLDDPDHQRLRRLVSQAFNQRSVDAFRPRIRADAEELLDQLAGVSTFDMVRAYASPLPIIVISEMLGVDPADRDSFERWSDAQLHMNNPFRTPKQEAELAWGQASLFDYLKNAVDARRAKRGTDLISAMVAAEEDGAKLSEREIVLNCNLLLLGGNLTTEDLITNGALALLRNPEQLELLKSRPELASNAVEEILRYDPPSTLTARIATADREIDGVPVEQGQLSGSRLWERPTIRPLTHIPSASTLSGVIAAILPSAGVRISASAPRLRARKVKSLFRCFLNGSRDYVWTRISQSGGGPRPYSTA